MLHLYHGASPAEFICFPPAHAVGLLCSLPLVIIFCEAQWEWLLGGMMEKGLAAATTVLLIYLASVAEVWYVVKEDVSQNLSVGWMNYFEEGSLLLPISLLFTPQLWEGITVHTQYSWTS